MRPLVERFGTGRNFRDWLLALKEIEIILEKHLGNEETQGRLIERDFVAGHVFGPIKSMFQKFLRDLPKTATRRLFALARSGGTLEEGEAVLRELISSQMKSVKTRVARALKEPTE